MSSTVTYGPPVYLLCRDEGKSSTPAFQSLCAQVNSSTLNSELTLQEVNPDPKGGVAAGQVFTYGSDNRIYLYNGAGATPKFCLGFPQPAQSGQPLQLQSPSLDPNDPTQQWTYSTQCPTFTNQGASSYAINDRSGDGSVGDSIAIFPGDPSNQAFSWVLASFAGATS